LPEAENESEGRFIASNGTHDTATERVTDIERETHGSGARRRPWLGRRISPGYLRRTRGCPPSPGAPRRGRGRTRGWRRGKRPSRRYL